MPKITALTASTVITDDDLMVIVDAPGGSAATFKITAANARRYFGISPTNLQTDHYTLVLSDQGATVVIDAGSDKNLTFPPNSSVAFPIGTLVGFEQQGAGNIVLTAGVGVTLKSYNSYLSTAGIDAIGTARKIGTDTWRVGGQLTT